MVITKSTAMVLVETSMAFFTVMRPCHTLPLVEFLGHPLALMEKSLGTSSSTEAGVI